MKKVFYILNSLLFIVAIFLGGLLFWAFPQQALSQAENRHLAQLPVWSWQAVQSGKLFREFENYYNDHFPLRESWIALSGYLKDLNGINNDEFKVLNTDFQQNIEAENERLLTEKEVFDEEKIVETLASSENEHLNNTIDNSQSAVNKNTPQTAEQQSVSEDLKPIKVSEEQAYSVTGKTNSQQHVPVATTELPPAEQNNSLNHSEFSSVKGVIVVKGRVIQNFGGTKQSVSAFAKLVNQYRQALPDNVRLYSMLIPTGGDFGLPTKVNHGVMRERENILSFHSMLLPGVEPVDAYAEIAPHKDEYISFYTDHHWTNLGAYYAYRAFAKQAGFRPLEPYELHFVKKDKTFLGSMYNYTKDSSLAKHPDHLEYYKIPNTVRSTIYKHGFKGKGIPGLLYVESANNYGLFLGGDFALTHLHSDVANNRSILLIKDSFGNALAPFLAAHYQDVYIIDYRYFKDSIPALIRELNINEMLYAHNVFAANSQGTIKLGRRMLTGGATQ